MILGQIAQTEIEELFTALFFNEQGAWIGFLIVASIMLLVTAKIKLSALPFSVVSVFIGVMMVAEGTLTTDSNLWWITVMYFAMPFFLILLMITDKKSW